jgi:hypoxanthine-guanine phosphoribosyltransferase
MSKQRSWQKREEIATNDVRKALSVPDPKRTAGKAILVYDDVFTDGHTLDEVARCLQLQGKASEVCSLPLQTIESDFAVDSTGFSVCRFYQWVAIRRTCRRIT